MQCYDWWMEPFWLASKNDQRTYYNIWKITIGQGDDYTTGSLLDVYFKNYYKMIAIDLSK